MTQINNLKKIDGSRTVFRITKNAQFQFSIMFPFPAGPQVPLVGVGIVTTGVTTVSGLDPKTVSGLVTGQPVSGYGIPSGATITAIPSSTSIVLSAAPTQSGSAVGLTFQPLPLDLTGIDFRMQVRAAPGTGAGYASSGYNNYPGISDDGIFLDMSTDNGLLINGGLSGVLSGVVDPKKLLFVPITTPNSLLTADIIATATDGGPINLMDRNGPASVIVYPGVTR